MTVCMTAFLCPCPLSAQVFAAKNTISYSGQLHARRMVSSLLSGDWDQVRNADKLPGDFSGRCWYGLLGNFDEAYDFLLSLGLLSDPSTSSKDKAKSKVNPYQSAFNKLLQFGSSARATKTAGSYGERPDRTISMGITCNMHPARYIPMERGEVGSHAASTKERFLVADRYNLMKSSLLIFAPLKDGAKKLTLIEARAFVAR